MYVTSGPRVDSTAATAAATLRASISNLLIPYTVHGLELSSQYRKAGEIQKKYQRTKKSPVRPEPNEAGKRNARRAPL
jgi:hypothetical protein